jgi:ribonuclease R
VEFSEADVLSALRESGSKGLKTKDIARQLGAGAKDLKHLRSILDSMEMEGAVIRGRRRRYHLPAEAGVLRGTVYGYGRKVAVFVPDGETYHLHVSDENLGGAHHGDRVLARLVRSAAGEKQARVVKVLERAGSDVLGRIPDKGDARTAFIDYDHAHKRVSIEPGSVAEAGDYVLVRVPRWGAPYERPQGRVTEVLGGQHTPAEDLAAVVREFNLPLSFPQAVLDEAEAIPHTIPPEELQRRQDLSDLTLFTIDPENAKDFDDAISVDEQDQGSLRLGVHIADVSHYVAQGAHIDYEAMARGRTVYLVDRVIPMLPARLSDEMASLKPGVPRLAVSLFMDVDGHGKVGGYWIKESVIVSKARLTYEEAQRLIDKGAGWRSTKQVKRIAQALEHADTLRRILKQNRIARGAVDLETPEVDVVLDSSGNTVDVKPARRLGSHNLIEELMVLANETVAQHMSYLGREFIYRVHEVPDVDDMADLASFAGAFGHRFRWTRGTSPRALQSLLDKVKGRPEHYIMSMFLLRSLKKALYSERNVGHFGLASKCYTHFTSPIRRYPDLMVHRLLKRYGLYKSVPEDRQAILKFVRRAAEIASIREIEGDEAERASIKAHIAEFMERKIGEEYWGIVSGIRDFGFFVMLEENLVEGLVHVTKLTDDYYTKDAIGTMLIGARTGRLFRMGDRVRVRVARVDRGRREVDFDIVDVEERGERGIVVQAQDRAERRRRHLEYAAEVRRERSAIAASGGRGKGPRRRRPSRRRKSASGGKPASDRRPAGRSKPARRGASTCGDGSRRGRKTRPRGNERVGR